ncbi:MAG: NAD-dependent epimerase/dehydratase family protein, partial [Candidatus Hydrothermarchaeales archaeon]
MSIIKEDLENIKNALKKDGLSFEEKRVLVTGGAGFLGSWICEVLIRQNAIVTCVDNLVSGLKNNLANLEGEENFTFIDHDISKPIILDGPFDFVMHLASRASPFEFEKHPIQILKANTLGIWVALGIAKKYDATFLYTSTSEIYGNPDPRFIPTPETYNGNVNPTGPRSCFSEDTEVLTKDGWKFFRNIKAEDEIITMDMRGTLEYQNPVEI